MSGPMSAVQPTGGDLLNHRRVSTGPMALSKFSYFTYYYDWYDPGCEAQANVTETSYSIREVFSTVTRNFLVTLVFSNVFQK